MGDFKLMFKICIVDDRPMYMRRRVGDLVCDGVYRAFFGGYEKDIVEENQAVKIDDVVDTSFRELIRVENLRGDADQMLRASTVEYQWNRNDEWETNDQFDPIPGGASITTAGIIERFKSSHVNVNILVIEAVLTLH